MQTILDIAEVFSSATALERQQNIRALLEQYLKNELCRETTPESVS